MAPSSHPKLSKSCDHCRLRKVRCKPSSTDKQTPCLNCLKRNQPCDFSPLQRPQRRKPLYPDATSETVKGSPFSNTTVPTVSPKVIDPNTPQDVHSLHNSLEHQPRTKPRELYIDKLLANVTMSPAKQQDGGPFKVGNLFGPSSSLAFFSQSRMIELSNRLGNDQILKLVETISSVVNARLSKMESVPMPWRANPKATNPPPLMDDTTLIQAFFDHIYPNYPFLDRKNFEQKVKGMEGLEPNTLDKSWIALYNTILALGSQYLGEGSFEPGKGQAWKHFEVSFSLFPQLLISKWSLVTVQAFTAMSIFSQSLACLQIERLFASEGARIAQTLGIGKNNDPNDESHKTFWVLYTLEKVSCFTTGRTSMFMDADISCPVPKVEESIFGELDWLLTQARLARIASRIHSELFTASSTIQSDNIDLLMNELEAWCCTIPEKIRPGKVLKLRSQAGNFPMSISLRMHYGYYSAFIALARASMHAEGHGAQFEHLQQGNTEKMMVAAQAILELTQFVDIEPYQSIWILALAPASALLILFDLVVLYPNHPQTPTNLALLDIGAGHFSRLERESQGSLPGSVISEFSYIARHFVRGLESAGKLAQQKPTTIESSSITTYPPIASNVIDKRPSMMAGVCTEYQQLTETSQSLRSPQLDNGASNLTSMAYNDSILSTAINQLYTQEEWVTGIDILDLFNSSFPDFNTI